jgi:hypothetical protein
MALRDYQIRFANAGRTNHDARMKQWSTAAAGQKRPVTDGGFWAANARAAGCTRMSCRDEWNRACTATRLGLQV